MRWLLNIPIRRKLTLITVLSCAIALLLAGSAMVAYEVVTYRTLKTRDVSVQAEIVATSVAAAMVFNDTEAAQEYLNALKANPEIAIAALYRDDGSVFTVYSRAGASSPPPEGLPVRPDAQGHRFEKDDLLVFSPVTETSRPIGSVFLRVNTEPLLTRLARFGGIILVVMVGSLLISLPISTRLHAVIANPVREISDAAGRIAAGEIVVWPPGEARADEIGILEEKFQQMVQSLEEKTAIGRQIASGDLAVRFTPKSDRDALGNAFAAMVESLQGKAQVATRIATGDLTVKISVQSDRDVLGTAFATMVANLRDMNREVGEGVNVLATSAGEILSGTTQVATGATKAAAGLDQTTVTVDEVKQIALRSNQKAKNVSEAAQKAAEVSQTGAKAVEETIHGMQLIREQMEVIGARILRLSEQTKAIGDIVATVSKLAERSNLLAVNASIEAARAGEHGKGFAVVAQEVKNLAEQSKQATAQVRTILGDIQKATASAVLATEQGSKAVEAGVKQSRGAGDAIQRLAQSIAHSAEGAAQIAMSAEQQLVGIDQLALAIGDIRTATTQNMESSKLAESAALSLHGLGQKLKVLLSKYKL